MDVEVPYMPSVTNLTKILDAIQKAGAPDAFGLDFLHLKQFAFKGGGLNRSMQHHLM
jgi:hypothetical protein